MRSGAQLQRIDGANFRLSLVRCDSKLICTVEFGVRSKSINQGALLTFGVIDEKTGLNKGLTNKTNGLGKNDNVRECGMAKRPDVDGRIGISAAALHE